jgi:hypothetical protein
VIVSNGSGKVNGRNPVAPSALVAAVFIEAKIGWSRLERPQLHFLRLFA